MSTPKNAEVGKLLEAIRPVSPPSAVAESPRLIVQEARPLRRAGRPRSRSTANVPSVKVSPEIPLALKRRIDVALADKLADEFPTFNDFATAAFRLLLQSRQMATD